MSRASDYLRLFVSPHGATRSLTLAFLTEHNGVGGEIVDAARQGGSGKLYFMSSSDSVNVVLQERDIAILKDLFECRLLSLDHIRLLHFPGKDEMAKKRVQLLKAAGYLIERPRKTGQPSILHLTWNGYITLRDGGHLNGEDGLVQKMFARRMSVSSTTVAHELAVADVRTAFIAAIRKDNRFEQVRFDVWPRRYEFAVNHGRESVTVKPDGHIRFIERQDNDTFEYSFFLEVDMGSETQDRLVEKCVNYREYYRSGGYAEFCGGKRDEHREFPFRILVVCQSEQRRDNLLKRLLEVQPPFSTMVMVGVVSAYPDNPLYSEWITPTGGHESIFN